MKWSAVCVFVATLGLVAQASLHTLPLSSCQTNCPKDEQPVCGSNGKTYRNKCLLALEKCDGKKVKLDYKGKCRAGAQQRPVSCRVEKEHILKAVESRQLLDFAVFVPECTANGGYTPMQCLKSSGYCWCVDINGKEVTGTRIKDKQPNCPAHEASQLKSRFKSSSWNFKHASQYKGCSQDARKNFNTKVVKLMEQEFMVYVEKTSTSGQKNLPGGGRLGKVNLLLWKFTDLDTNADYMLEPKELFSFLKKTKKSVPPKKCSKTFIGYCNQDENVKISLSEWYTCLGVQEVKKCMGEYLAAVKARQHSSSAAKLYMPRCTSDGSFNPTQCHSTIGYCWCVDVHSGKPIQGTTKKTNSLDCWQYVTKANVSRKAGKKDCAGDMWVVFKKQLLKIFRKELEDSSGTGNTKETPIRIHRSARAGDLQSRGNVLTDRQVLLWKYKRLDTNHDKLLNSSEFLVSEMKKVLGQVKRGRKCGRKVLSDCDYDKDKRISQLEWNHCLRTGHRMSLH